MTWQQLPPQTRLLGLVIASVAVIVVTHPVAAQTYLTPDGSAPSANSVPVAPPLNSSATIQRKAGTLLIGPSGGTAKLCLNADATTDTSGRCIDSWDDVLSSIGGPFLHYDSSTTYSVATGQLPGSYTPGPGFARLNADCSSPGCPAGSIQLYSYLTAAPTGNNGSGAPITGAYGLYATDGGTGANYAAYFSGKLHIYQTIPGGSLGQICLNGLTPNTECIDQWTDVSNGGSYLELQPLNATPTPNTGSFSVSGTGLLGSAVVDSPTALTSWTATCGDGMCTANNGENATNCPIDCATISSLVSARVTPNTGKLGCSGDPLIACFSSSTCAAAGKGVCQSYSGEVKISTPSTQLPAGSQVRVMVVRSFGAAPTFVPLQGSTYTTGSIHGDSTIIYAGTMNQNQINALVSYDRVTSAGTYYYRAFIGNLYPRYSPVYTPTVDAQVTYVRLLVTKTLNGGAPASELPDGQINCANSPTNYCTGFYQSGTTVSLSADAVTAGYTFLGWTGCVEPFGPTNPSCTITMDSDKVVTASYSSGGGGGGGGGGGNQVDI